MDFLHNSLQLIEHYMLVYGYWAVFFGVMLENAGVPVPVKPFFWWPAITLRLVNSILPW